MIVPLRILLTGFLLVMPGFVAAQGNQPNDGLPPVTELVERLGSPKREVRNAAEEQLIKHGPAILAELPEYDAVKSPDVRSALFRVRQALENQKIEQSLRSTTLKFPARALTLPETVELIREKTGNDLRIAGSLEVPESSLRFEPKEYTFWDAVIQLIETYHLDLEVGDSGRGLVFVAAREPRFYFASHDISGKYADSPVAWRINKVERKPIAGRDDEELSRFEMQLLFEPRLTPLFVKISGNQLAYRITKDVERPAGRKQLLAFSPDAVTEISCHQLPITPVFRVDWMVAPDDQVAAISYHPAAEVTLAVGRFDFEFRNWDQTRTSLRRGLGVVVRDELQITDDEVSFLLILLFSERGAPFESHREWLSQNLIELKSGDQILEPNAPPEKELEADGSVAFRYRFARPSGTPDDWTLHYRFPTSFREITARSSEVIELSKWLQPDKNQRNPE